MNNGIVLVNNKAEAKILRIRTKHFAISEKGAFSIDKKPVGRADIRVLIERMRKAMQEANGIGLSANQIGLPYRVFVARVPNSQGNLKSYAIFNPEIEKIGSEKALLEEGCLSVPGIYGHVERAKQVLLRGYDRNGRPVKIKAWGILSHVFQHEVDHLNGIVFIDKAKELHEAPVSERLQQRETR
jgi:peptide deformylase